MRRANIAWVPRLAVLAALSTQSRPLAPPCPLHERPC